MKKNSIVSTLPSVVNTRLRGLVFLLALAGIGLGLFFFTTSRANASFIYQLAVTPIATQENLWAHVEVAKPVSTAASVPILPTEASTSLPVSAETPATLMMEIVDGEASAAAQSQEHADASPPSITTNGSKYILVDISEQHMYVYENNALIYNFIVSTGINNATRVGTFAVQTKLPNAYGATWNIWMPNWLGIYYSGSLENGIHALPILPSGATLWEGFLGRPVSYGCVVLGTADSILLYDWAELGTTVEIQR